MIKSFDDHFQDPEGHTGSKCTSKYRGYTIYLVQEQIQGEYRGPGPPPFFNSIISSKGSKYSNRAVTYTNNQSPTLTEFVSMLNFKQLLSFICNITLKYYLKNSKFSWEHSPRPRKWQLYACTCFTKLCLTKLTPYLLNGILHHSYLLQKVIGTGCSCIYGICNCHAQYMLLSMLYYQFSAYCLKIYSA